ncbi:MAG: ribonucleotide reductase N-terminal alpha domain-containing protein [Chloroflexota bacterium]
MSSKLAANGSHMAVLEPTVSQPNSQTTYTVFEHIKGEREQIIAPEYASDEKIALSENSTKVLERRYLRKDLNGALLETPAGMFYRVAHHVAQIEEEHGGDAQGMAQTFYDLMTERRFFPNSPTFTGAGTPLGQLAACFVLPISDDMGKENDGIFSTLRVAALIQQTGGGNGFAFSRLRPKGDIVHASSGQATGPVGFLRVYDQAFGEVAQGGTRRGANMAVLRVDHPDIEDFITCKAEEGSISNFNISVAITDEFMRAVKDDTPFDLRNPRTHEVWKTVQAKELFEKIIKYAHHNGEPGALFIDKANESNPVPHLYDLEATNPCVTGETWIYTSSGLRKAQDLFDSQENVEIVLDSRFGEEYTLSNASPVFYTGDKLVYRLKTREGYEVDATGDHRIMTTKGWVELSNLQEGEKVHILNQKGGFGTEGNLPLGRTIGWLMGDGTFNMAEGAALMFFGEEQSLAPLFASYVNEIVGPEQHNNQFAPTRTYPVGVQEISQRNETRVVSTRLKEQMSQLGFRGKEAVPQIVFTGTEEMQRGFLQGIFSADGTVLDNVNKGVNVRLWSIKGDLLKEIQQLLLNFGIASKIYLDRKKAGTKAMPDGKGGYKEYFVQAGHELVISKSNLLTFQKEIDFLQADKSEKLAHALERYGNRGPYAEYFVATVDSVTELGVQPVFDLTEPLTHSFIANGIVVHNCGEQWLGPYENCCLGSINLAVHVTADETGNAQVDWGLLRRSVEESTNFLDNVVSVNKYVPVVPAVAEAAYSARRIGLGIMGLGDMMYKLGVRYGSEEGQEFSAQVMEFVRFHCMKKSIELAKERDPFVSFDGSIYDAKQPGGMKWQPPQSVIPYSRNWSRPSLDWNAITDGITEHGLRNAAQTTVAPTGTIATVCGCEGYGCEPVFALGYIRHFKDGDKDVELPYTSPLFEYALNQTDLSEARKEEIKQHVALHGNCQDIEGLPEAIRHTFVVSSDISAEKHVRMQAAIQAFVDNSISKTCNFSEDATEKDVADAYKLAWELGCKGLTVYVTGSRQQVVLETKATQQKKEADESIEQEQSQGSELNGHKPTAEFINGQKSQNGLSKTHTPTASANGTSNYPTNPMLAKRPRPHALRGSTYRKQTPLGNAYVTVNNDDQDQPFEVFLNVGKAGSDVAAVSEAIGRLISLVLRMPGSLVPAERMKWVIDELASIGSGRPLGFGQNRVRSLPDGIAQVLAEHLSMIEPAEIDEIVEQLALPISQHAIGDICPDCGEATFLNIEGCKKCHVCGYSEC